MKENVFIEQFRNSVNTVLKNKKASYNFTNVFKFQDIEGLQVIFEKPLNTQEKTILSTFLSNTQYIQKEFLSLLLDKIIEKKITLNLGDTVAVPVQLFPLFTEGCAIHSDLFAAKLSNTSIKSVSNLAELFDKHPTVLAPHLASDYLDIFGSKFKMAYLFKGIQTLAEGLYTMNYLKKTLIGTKNNAESLTHSIEQCIEKIPDDHRLALLNKFMSAGFKANFSNENLKKQSMKFYNHFFSALIQEQNTTIFLKNFELNYVDSTMSLNKSSALQSLIEKKVIMDQVSKKKNDQVTLKPKPIL